MYESISFSPSSPAFVILLFAFYNSHPYWGEMLSPCGFDAHFLDD
jgi:hypothetical protein